MIAPPHGPVKPGPHDKDYFPLTGISTGIDRGLRGSISSRMAV